MVGNYLKVAFRNLLRNKTTSAINVCGLAIGLTCVLFTVLWVQDEFSYDHFHDNAERLFLLGQSREMATGRQTTSTQPAPLAPMLQARIPDIQEYARFYLERRSLSGADKDFQEAVCFADPSFLTMFSFSLTYGDPSAALTAPHSIVLTHEVAEKFFGEVNPVGQVLTLGEGIELEVTGVFAEPPGNSSLPLEPVVPITLLNELGRNINEVGGSDYYTWLLVPEHVTAKQLQAKVQSVTCDLFRQLSGEADCPLTMLLHPLSKYHLYALGAEGGRIEYVYILLAIGVVVLAIACLNFVNISTARASVRAREIGMRKVVGADRFQLIRQLLGETLLNSVLASAVAIVLIELLLPVFNGLSGKALTLSIDNGILLVSLFGATMLTGVAAGLYPAFYLSRFQPVSVMKGEIVRGRSGLLFRRTLVVAQFALSLTLIVGSLAVSKQLEFIRTRDLGFNRDNVVYCVPSDGILSRYEEFRTELLDHPGIVSVTGSVQGLSHVNSTIGQGFDYEGKDPNLALEVHFDWVSYDFAETFDMEMVAGRFYSREFASDASEGIVLNETAVRLMGIEAPIGKRFSYWGHEKRIIGVVSDFHLEPLYETLKPMLLLYTDQPQYVYVRLEPSQTASALAHMETVYGNLEPDGMFSYRFLDEMYERQYRSDQRLGTIITYGTGLAIVVACLGLFGLASFVTARRSREIGIRRVLGATSAGLVRMLLMDVLIPVAIANIIAWPIAYFAVSRWLGNFAYRATIGPDMYVLSALLALVIATLTVSYQTVRAALADPVESLKYE